jgi:hypothetical protein
MTPTLIKELQQAVPGHSRLAWLAQVLGAGATLAPGLGLAPTALRELSSVGLLPDGARFVPLALAGGLGVFYGAKALEAFAPKPARGVWIGDMFIEEDAFWTSILITGRPGAGKTSGAIMPIAEQIIRLYTGEDYIDVVEDGQHVRRENPYARIGGIVLEVKGEFYEMVGYLLDQLGRNIYEDFLVLRPDSSLPVAQFQDPDTSHYFYLNGMPCASGSEAGMLLLRAQAHLPRERQIREDIFSCQDKEFSDALPALRALEFPVAGQQVHFVGWRPHGSGHLLRITHTPNFHAPAPMLGAQGREIVIPAPHRLRFINRVLVSNGLRYNLIDPSVGPNEAAEKLTRMAAVSGRGEAKGGDNAYWYNNAQKLISNCIALHRAVEPEKDVTCADVFRLVATEKDLAQALGGLSQRLTALRSQIAREDDKDRKAELETRQLNPLIALEKFFTGEWKDLDEKPKSTIKNVVSNTFSQFVFDPALRETFCSRATFSFADCLNRGRIFCFVPGRQYETLAKPIGVGLKLDSQAECMMRLNRADYNKRRPFLHLTDECWNWAISGGASGGDPKFLSLCREPRVIHVLATQNLNQFVREIGREDTQAYFACFGTFVWLQNWDQLTNEMAERLMETVKREKLKTHSSALHPLGLMDANAAPARIEQQWEEKRLYEHQDFVKLGGDEAIVFNGRRTKNMAQKTKLPKSDLTHPKTKPKIAAFMREFLRGSIEQALWREGRSDRVNHISAASSVRGAVATAAPPPRAIASPPPPGTPPATVAPPAAKAEVPKTVASPPQPLPDQAAKPPLPAAPAPVVPPPAGTAQSPAPPAAYSAGAKPIRKLDWTFRPPQAGASPAVPDPGQAATTGGGGAPVTPRVIDTESAEFRQMWNRLAGAASEVVADDELGMRSWLQKLVKEARAGGQVAPDILVGPKGFTAGDQNLVERPSPLAGSPVDHLATQDQTARARQRQLQELAFQEKGGPAGDDDDWH